MGTIYLSDLHFGDGSKADDFGPSDSSWGRQADWDLMDRVDQWKRNGDRVVLVGDIFDLWQCRDMQKILAAHGNVIRALFAITDIYVAGNHDADLLFGEIQGVRVRPWAWMGDVWVQHGHTHDRLITRLPRTCRVITWVAGWLERRVHRDIDLWGERFARFIGGIGRHGISNRYVPLVAARAQAMGCHTAVFGHTHEAWDWVHDVAGQQIKVLNCGTWTNGQRDRVKL